MINAADYVKRLPMPAKQALKFAYGVIPPTIRYGRTFRETRAFLQKSEWWDKRDLEDYQRHRLKELIHHAYENVPYYKRVFDERGLKPEDIQDIPDLRLLPVLTKDMIRQNLSGLTAKNYPTSKLQYAASGGTTGTPVEFYWERGVTDPKELAFVWRAWNWAGYELGERRVTLRDNIVKRFMNDERQWWQYDPLEKALILSSFQMTEENLPKYVDKIRRFKPAAVQGFPSSLYMVAKYLERNDLRIDNIKCILTSSETLYPLQRKVIEKQFGAKVFDLYGHSEKTVFVTQCEAGSYHIIPEYGILELIGKNGNPVTEDGEQGDIITTGFNNFAMPLIRFQTDDLGSYNMSRCSCGRESALLASVDGRKQDFFITKSMYRIPLTAVSESVLAESGFIRCHQFYQDTPGEVIVRIENTREVTEEETDVILEGLNQGVDSEIRFQVECVRSIEKSRIGKCPLLVQKLRSGTDYGNSLCL